MNLQRTLEMIEQRLGQLSAIEARLEALQKEVREVLPPLQEMRVASLARDVAKNGPEAIKGWNKERKKHLARA